MKSLKKQKHNNELLNQIQSMIGPDTSTKTTEADDDVILIEDDSDIRLNRNSNAKSICTLNNCVQVNESLPSLNSPQINIKEVNTL